MQLLFCSKQNFETSAIINGPAAAALTTESPKYLHSFISHSDLKDFLFIAKLRTHLMDLELANSPSTFFLQAKELPFELDFIGNNIHPLLCFSPKQEKYGENLCQAALAIFFLLVPSLVPKLVV